ncbi:MAG: hypothetical protein R3228_18885 [Halioglobus sp.]|nr:hypothetical protein [Halioglobus sp.]
MTMLKTLTAVLLLTALPAMAQLGPIEGARNNRQLLAMGLYPPDLIMRHQQTLGITESQRKAMLKLVKDFQAEVAELQWNLQNEQQQMRQSLAENRIDTAAVVPRVERVLDMESQFKLAHFKLLIAIKNELTDAQIEQIRQRLREMRQRNK